MMRWGTLLIWICFLRGTHAQETFHWLEGMCRHTGTIDTLCFNLEEVRNIYTYLIEPREAVRPYLATKPSDSTYLSEETIRSECKQIQLELSNLDLPEDPYWEGIRQQRLQELKRACTMKELAIVAFKKPIVLRNDSAAYAACSAVSEILISGGEPLMDCWIGFNETVIAQSPAPDQLRASFEKQKNSPEAAWWARLEVMRYLWWNCASNTCTSAIHTNELEHAFRQLFIRVEKSCK